MNKSVIFALVAVAFAGRVRRQSSFRLEFNSLIPKSVKSVSAYKDNVVTMVAIKLKNDGLKKKEVQNAVENVFTHGCHCSSLTNLGRRK
jgi:hypothetical protein